MSEYRNRKQPAATERTLKERFLTEEIMPEPGRKQAAMELLAQAVEKKEIQCKPSFADLVRMQMTLLNKESFLVQTAVLICILVLFARFGNSMEKTRLYVMGAASAAVVSIFVAAAGLKDERFHLTELASSCFFNSREVCVLRLICCGGLNLVFLTVLVILVGNTGNSGLVKTGIYIFVPYLVSGSLHFLAMLIEKGKNVFGGLGISVTAVTGGCIAVCAFPNIYEEAAFVFWIAAFFVFAGIYAGELLVLLKQMDRGERLCMN